MALCVAQSGPYSFGYTTADGQSRQESGHGGAVTGAYSYIDANGDLRQVCFNAFPFQIVKIFNQVHLKNRSDMSLTPTDTEQRVTSVSTEGPLRPPPLCPPSHPRPPSRPPLHPWLQHLVLLPNTLPVPPGAIPGVVHGVDTLPLPWLLPSLLLPLHHGQLLASGVTKLIPQLTRSRSRSKLNILS